MQRCTRFAPMQRRALRADQVRTFSIVVSPVARVGTVMVVPAVVSTSIFGPVLTANDPRRAIGVVLGHEPMIPPVAGLSP